MNSCNCQASFQRRRKPLLEFRYRLCPPLLSAFGLFFALIIVASPFGATQLISALAAAAVMALRHFAGMQKAAVDAVVFREVAPKATRSSRNLVLALWAPQIPPFSERPLAAIFRMPTECRSSIGRTANNQLEKLVLPFGRKKTRGSAEFSLQS